MHLAALRMLVGAAVVTWAHDGLPDDVLAPGVRYDLDETVYRASPGLSYSGAKVLLDAPARYRYERDHGRAPKREFDLGHVAHRLLLGKGAEIEPIYGHYDDKSKRAGELWTDYTTKAAQEARDAARAAGRVPVLVHEYDAAQRMAQAVRDSSSGALFEVGDPEVTLAWKDDETGVPLRARVDWLRAEAIVDMKTCTKASPGAISKACYDFGYYMQDHVYREGARACGLGDLPFIFVFVETAQPHLVTPVCLDPAAQALGAQKWREAIDLYDACCRADNWPEYATEILEISLPAYAR